MSEPASQSKLDTEIADKVALEEWNLQHIRLSQALLGAISQNFRLVWLRHTENEWEIGVVLRQDNDSDREEINDVGTQFEAFQDGAIRCRIEVVINDSKLSWPDPPNRIIFRRKED
jgi:hypothetical protein